MYKVIYSRKADKNLEKIPRKWQVRLHKRIETLQENPFQGKKLQGELKGLHAIRIWPYRIVYTVHKKEITIFIVDIAHRQSVYRNL